MCERWLLLRIKPGISPTKSASSNRWLLCDNSLKDTSYEKSFCNGKHRSADPKVDTIDPKQVKEVCKPEMRAETIKPTSQNKRERATVVESADSSYFQRCDKISVANLSKTLVVTKKAIKNRQDIAGANKEPGCQMKANETIRLQRISLLQTSTWKQAVRSDNRSG